MGIDTTPEILNESQGISRRGVFKLLFYAGVGSVIGPRIIKGVKGVLDNISSPEERIDKLKTEIEQAYGVDVVGPQELQTVTIFGSQMSTIEWKENELQILSRTLKDLPSHFYSQTSGNKLLFAIVNPETKGESLTDNSYIMWCDCAAGVEPDVVAIEQGFMEIGYEYSRSSIIHELTHRVFGFKKAEYLIYEADGRSSLANVGIWNTDLERVGRILDDLEKRDRQRMFENLNFRNVLNYGVQNWDEFVATAGKTYIYGRKHFVESYGEYFGKPTADNLYDFMRNNIFRGKEY